jgi:cytochrome c
MSNFIMVLLSLYLLWPVDLIGAERRSYPPLIPLEKLEEIRGRENPFPLDQALIEKGKTLYEGRAFCAACHAKDGSGWRKDLDYTNIGPPYPPDFTDMDWQTVRSDGELFWILKEGSHGTDMAPFLPLYLEEDEAWHIILYIRTFGKLSDKL